MKFFKQIAPLFILAAVVSFGATYAVHRSGTITPQRSMIPPYYQVMITLHQDGNPTSEEFLQKIYLDGLEVMERTELGPDAVQFHCKFDDHELEFELLNRVYISYGEDSGFDHIPYQPIGTR